MIAVDTNILVYAHRKESPFHQVAAARLNDLATAPARWALPWPCVHEFLAIVTNAKVYREPTPLDTALRVIEVLFQQPNCDFLAEGDMHLGALSELARAGRTTGAKIHDARIAAICVAHGVRELWSADRDFSRFPPLRTVNPLVG